MTNTFGHLAGHLSGLKHLNAMRSGVEGVTEPIDLRSIIAGIRRYSEPRQLTISPHYAAVPVAVMRQSPVSFAGGDTAAVSIKQKTLNASLPDGQAPPAGYQRSKFRIRGVAPLIMHNGQLANPLNRFAKEMKKVAGKRAKTEADFEELARLEFLGSLYVDNGQPCIPGEVLEATLIEAAKKNRRGMQTKAGVVCSENFSLVYDGPRSPNDLWMDERFRFSIGVRVQRNRVIRTRPIFRDWAAEISVDFMPSQLNKDEIAEMVRTAGLVVGLGDWRPKFGRFQIAD